jgi:predicted neuraminidase
MSESWKESILCLSSSEDGGQTWSHPSILLPQIGFMGKTQPIQLQAGKIIIPIYNEEQFCPFVMILNDMENLQNQKIVAETMARGIALQPVVTELESDKLLMLCRTNKGKIWGSYSYNGGLSWSILSPTLIPNPNSAIDLITTNTDELILAFNHSETNRYSLSVSLSMDKGKSWSFLQDLERGEGEYSYPCLMEDHQGLIHIVYTESRYRIMHIQFDLDWLKQGALKTPVITFETPPIS